MENTSTQHDLQNTLSLRIRELRRQRHWTLEQLSTASGVSRSMLSEIERGRANPTLAVTLRIADAFALTLDQLVQDNARRRGIDIIRGSDKNSFFRMDPDCQIQTLSPLHLEKDIEFYSIRLQPNASLDSSPHFRGTREIVTVHQGSLAITAGQHHEQLESGDSACYPADQEHQLRNCGDSVLQLYLIVTYQS